MKKCPSEELIIMLAEGELDERETNSITEHTAGCDECRRLLDDYRKTLALARNETMEGLAPCEWERLMEGIRQRAEKKGLAWPSWARGTAIAVATAAVVAVIVWQAGFRSGPAPEGTPQLAERYDNAATSEGRVEVEPRALPEEDRLARTAGTSEELRAQDTRILSAEKDVFGDVFLEDTAPLNLAELEGELLEASEFIVDAGALQDSEFLLFYLSEEEETELVKELESSSS